MKVPAVLRAIGLAALTTFTVGMAFAQQPAPAPKPAAQAPASDALPVPPPPEVAGTAWIVMDAASGNVLAGENIDQPLEPASITKVMTSYVIAAEMAGGKVSEDDQVMMTEHAWRTGGAGTDGSYSGFEVNKTAPLVQMEKGMVVQSGNDAAIALAQHVAGSVDAFAALMNMYAERIGMRNSHFVNPTGLPAEGHVSSARDLALLGRALIRDFPKAYSYNSIREFTVGPITQPNRNVLLWRDQSVDGIKTGHTSGAGYCLMASAERGDQRLITVVLGSTSEKQRADDSQALLNWGFRFYETHKLYDAGTQVADQKVWKGASDRLQLGVAEPLLVTIPRGRYERLKPMMDVPKTLVAPIAKGQEIGTVKVMLDDKVVAQRPLVALNAVEEGGFFKRLWDEFWMWWESV
ncbi:MAG: D-alanyl-D-alanine carboxypeptidase [Lysobacter sp.]|jgi:serine-type D-Ala-D-Ala carboxypeptidase (penicillin-binding protein 5/6)|uniref:serine-type D-Ala-D-Ala carboxypeptidase n=1 Tax=Novilysobacter luteus TaxID=2822368 RepID=A0ABN7R5V6_9GAMM|nr:D-alanyl-D-alanine carboxypeptidase family protein [Lysobacter luteus]MDV3254662.1 D-alanyl-D-alanine carboxypeptidase [Lysobacter sp.]MDV5980656.1 D-alanyl-D-alanine carboxypeptidase [Lysobacter sp.]CAG4977426.1 D-alanyl-D-alanine carboxypeptidase DacC [Lysobacter luteus]